MPKFHYRVLDEAGRESTGELLAEDNAEALAKLQEAGWYVLQVRPVNAGAGRLAQWWRDRFQKVKLKEFVAFCRQFATLVNAGVSALRALEVLQDQTKDRKLAETLEALYTDIASGLSLTEAMSKHPRVFSPLFRSMIRAAEAGGILDEVLARLADYLEDELEMKGKVKSALTYPVVVLFFALVVVMVLVFFILPKFGQIFEDIGAPLPVTTRLLLESSEFLLHHWYLMPLTVIGLMVGLRAYGNHPRGRRHLDWLKLKLPIAGELLQKVAIARFARTFASLAASGFPVLQALDIVADTAGNEIIGDAIRTAQGLVREGEDISGPLQQTGIFPEMVIQMIAVGEETGLLDLMLTKVAQFYEAEVDRTLKSLTSLIEPLMIVGLGLLVGFVAVSVITPIYELMGQVEKL